MEDERQARMQYEKECNDLRNKLRVLEKEKAQLVVDMDIKEREKARVEERESLLHKERWSFIQNLSEVDTECKIQTNANIKLCEEMEKLMGIEKSLEMGLLRERRTMNEMMEEMKVQRQQHQNSLRQLDMTVKGKRDVEENLVYSFQKEKDLERSVTHWKEELSLKERENQGQNREIWDLKRRNSHVRCILADTKHKLSGCLSEMKSLENEKRKAEVDLRSAKLHEKSLQLEIKKNELRKFKLAEKILKTYPYLLHQQRTSNDDTSRFPSFSKGGDHLRPCTNKKNTEIESYQKRIWKLERHKEEVDRKLKELHRKENIYRIKLDKYAGMEKQIFWTGKAMAKLEGDRNRLERLLKTMESNMPMKVPFKKLVTDPSVLDRLAKNKVLQKRIFQQAEKIEELKSSARRLLQFREEQFGVMDQQYGGGDDIPTWKLAYWSKSSINPENLISGMNLDIMRRLPDEQKSMRPFTDENYYKKYMHHLNEEIPKLKLEIDQLERKKLFIEVEKENEAELEKQKSRATATKAEPVKKSALLLLGDEQKVGVGEGDEGSEDGAGDKGRKCTPDQSMHGSSYADAGPDIDPTAKASKVSGDKKKALETQKKPRSPKSSTESATEDERDDLVEEGSNGSSGDAASEIPSDKS